MSFQKTKRAHTLEPGDVIRFKNGFGGPDVATVESVSNKPTSTWVTFEGEGAYMFERNERIEILNPRG